MKYFVYIVVFAALIILGTWIIQFAWSLFAPSVFGLPYLSFKEAFGLSLFVGMFGLRNTNTRNT